MANTIPHCFTFYVYDFGVCTPLQSKINSQPTYIVLSINYAKPKFVFFFSSSSLFVHSLHKRHIVLLLNIVFFSSFPLNENVSFHRCVAIRSHLISTMAREEKKKITIYSWKTMNDSRHKMDVPFHIFLKKMSISVIYLLFGAAMDCVSHLNVVMRRFIVDIKVGVKRMLFHILFFFRFFFLFSIFLWAYLVLGRWIENGAENVNESQFKNKDLTRFFSIRRLFSLSQFLSSCRQKIFAFHVYRFFFSLRVFFSFWRERTFSV